MDYSTLERGLRYHMGRVHDYVIPGAKELGRHEQVAEMRETLDEAARALVNRDLQGIYAAYELLRVYSAPLTQAARARREARARIEAEKETARAPTDATRLVPRVRTAAEIEAAKLAKALDMLRWLRKRDPR